MSPLTIASHLLQVLPGLLVITGEPAVLIFPVRSVRVVNCFEYIYMQKHLNLTSIFFGMWLDRGSCPVLVSQHLKDIFLSSSCLFYY